MHNIIFFGQTDVGVKRKKNEDTFVVSPALGFCLAADGMGGAAAGEVASRIFAETAEDVFAGSKNPSDADTLSLVRKTFLTANRRIFRYAEKKVDHLGMGCTAELMAFFGEGYILGHIGDSRTYRFREGQLKRLTEDHSFVQEQINQGVITPEEARTHHLRNVILRAVGVSENLVPDLLRGKAVPGDLYLLCSDGLTDMVEDDLIKQILSLPVSLSQKAEDLIDAAKSAGGNDNITVVLSEIR